MHESTTHAIKPPAKPSRGSSESRVVCCRPHEKPWHIRKGRHGVSGPIRGSHSLITALHLEAPLILHLHLRLHPLPPPSHAVRPPTTSLPPASNRIRPDLNGKGDGPTHGLQKVPGTLCLDAPGHPIPPRSQTLIFRGFGMSQRRLRALLVRFTQSQCPGSSRICESGPCLLTLCIAPSHYVMTLARWKLLMVVVSVSRP